MSTLHTFIKSRGVFSVLLSVILTLLFVFVTVQAATTISTDVTTGGNVYATSTLVIDGSVILGGTAGAPTIGIASSTPWGLLSVEATSTVGADAPMFVVSDQGTSTPAFYITGNDGSVGLGTTSPSVTPLGVVGDVYISSGLGVGMVVTADGRISASADIAVASTSPWGQFSVEAFNLSGDAPIFVIGDQGTSTPFLFVSGNDGSIGIGSTTPSATPLGIVGDVYVSSGLGVGHVETTDGRLTVLTDAGIATTTPSEPLSVGGDVSIGSAATTTVFIDSTDAASGGCLQMRGGNGTLYRAYLVSTTTQDISAENVIWQIEAGTCQ